MTTGEDIVDDVRARLSLPELTGTTAAVRYGDAVEAIASTLRPAMSDAERWVRTELNRAANQARDEAIRQASTPDAPVLEVWVAERDACVHCSALAGQVSAPGEEFDATATFGSKPLGTDRPLEHPPRHPYCRCRIVPHRPEWGSEFPDALRREAERSIARGWATDSEPNQVRKDAAERLLARDPDLPKSVKTVAARQIRRGEVARPLPTRDPDVRRRWAARDRARWLRRARRVGRDAAILELGYPTVATADEWLS